MVDRSVISCAHDQKLSHFSHSFAVQCCVVLKMKQKLLNLLLCLRNFPATILNLSRLRAHLLSISIQLNMILVDCDQSRQPRMLQSKSATALVWAMGQFPSYVTSLSRTWAYAYFTWNQNPRSSQPYTCTIVS